MRQEMEPDVPAFLVKNGRKDAGNIRALARLENAINDIAEGNTNMAIDRPANEFAPRLTARDLDRVAERAAVPAEYETAEQAVASWIIGMAYTDLKKISKGLEEHAKLKPPTTYQDFVELLHSWAVEVVDPRPIAVGESARC